MSNMGIKKGVFKGFAIVRDRYGKIKVGPNYDKLKPEYRKILDQLLEDEKNAT